MPSISKPKQSSRAAGKCETPYCMNHNKYSGNGRNRTAAIHSTHLAPSDYHLFRFMAHFLQGRNFENIEAVEVGFTKFLASETRDRYRREIINLAERWLKTIESDGLYFEN